MKMPFSKLPKARALQRLVDQKEKEIDGLRNALNKVQEGQNNTDNTDDMAAPIALSTPQREAVQLCDSMNVTPTAPRIRAVLPLTAAVDAVKNAPTDIKKKLFSGRKSRKVNRIASAVSKKIKLSRNLVHSEHSAKTMRLSLAKSKKTMVNTFLRRADNSAELPSKWDQARGHVKHALTDTLCNLHTKFANENPDIPVSLAQFCKARHPSIKLISFTNRRQCLCTWCANIALSLKVIPGITKSPKGLAALEDDEIQAKLQNVPEQIEYKQWKRSDVEFKGRNIKKTKLVDVVEKKETFIKEFKAGIMSFRAHCGRIATQYTQLRKLKQSLAPLTEVTVQMDYVENWSAKFNEEPTAVYYDKAQISLHPMIVHNKTEEDVLVATSFVGSHS